MEVRDGIIWIIPDSGCIPRSTMYMHSTDIPLCEADDALKYAQRLISLYSCDDGVAMIRQMIPNIHYVTNIVAALLPIR